MSLTGTDTPTFKTKRPPPFSLRLNAEERARLVREADGAPLGAYIKTKVLSGNPLRTRRTGASVEDREALAKALALLGRAELQASLRTLADAAASGSLPVDPDTEAAIRAAVADIGLIRQTLLLALGLLEEARR